MSPRPRAILSAVAAAVLFVVLVAGFVRLPAFGAYHGPYGIMLNAVAPHERKIENIVTAVNFDYRGLDTLGEEFILFAAVAGLTLVLRKDRAETTPEPLPPAPNRTTSERTDAVRAFAILAAAVTVAFGWYMAIHPHLSAGGGFQGGAITAGFAALLFLGLGYQPCKDFAAQRRAEPLEAIGAVGYVVVGIIALVVSGAFLANVLPLGVPGALFSTGTITVINAFVAFEVIAGFIVMFAEFADETRVERTPPESRSAE